MHNSPKKLFVLLFVLLLSTVCWGAIITCSYDEQHPIVIKESSVQGPPKGSTIQASIHGHALTVTFTENLGDVQIDITSASGGAVSYGHVWTPDSYIAYITNTGSYVVTITLENGDEYYGEFEVTD